MQFASRLSVLLSFVLALIILACSGEEKIQTPETDRTTTPDFILLDTEGDTFQLSKNVGNAHLINFFLTNCPVCQAEVDSLKVLHEEYKNRGLVVLGIVMNGTIDDIKAFMAWKDIKYRILIDDGRTSLGYGVLTKVPLNRVVDWEGWTVYDRLVVDLELAVPELRQAIEIALPPVGG